MYSIIVKSQITLLYITLLTCLVLYKIHLIYIAFALPNELRSYMLKDASARFHKQRCEVVFRHESKSYSGVSSCTDSYFEFVLCNISNIGNNRSHYSSHLEQSHCFVNSVAILKVTRFKILDSHFGMRRWLEPKWGRKFWPVSRVIWVATDL